MGLVNSLDGHMVVTVSRRCDLCAVRRALPGYLSLQSSSTLKFKTHFSSHRREIHHGQMYVCVYGTAHHRHGPHTRQCLDTAFEDEGTSGEAGGAVGRHRALVLAAELAWELVPAGSAERWMLLVN